MIEFVVAAHSLSFMLKYYKLYSDAYFACVELLRMEYTQRSLAGCEYGRGRSGKARWALFFQYRVLRMLLAIWIIQAKMQPTAFMTQHSALHDKVGSVYQITQF